MPSINPAEAFNGGIKRPGVGIFYTLGLLGVTFVMALLPVIYLCLIGLVAYGTYYHAVYHYSWVAGGLGYIPRVWIIKFFIFVTPVFMGIIMTIFMVKPFFARSIYQHQPYALNPASEPVLYNFIVRVCNIVGAPIPSLIELDSSINFSAGFRHGFRSFFGNDLVLRIGLPFVAGLTVREFAGVLAHEFGHFTQGTAMRLKYIIGRIDGWFERVIWERDSWDAWLEEMGSDEEGGWITIMAAFARLGVWFSRKILTLLLIFGHAFSCYLSRRMEFHADQFQISVAGSDAFESTKQRVTTLCFLHEIGLQQMQVTWNLNKRLPDNLPHFILNMEGTQTGAQVRKVMKGRLGFVKTGLFHTHPSDADRVRAARLANAPGIVTVDAPATELFENFPVPARIVTTLFYQAIDLPLGVAKIYAVECPKPKSEQIETQTQDSPEAAVDRYFSGVVTPLRPIFPRLATVDESRITETINEIEALPAQINAVSDQVAQACANFDYADKMMLAAAQDDSRTAEGVDAANWRAQREQARHSLQSVFDAYENRISSALGLSQTSAFARLAPNAADIRQSIATGIDHLVKLRTILRLADPLRTSTAALLRGSGNETPVVARLREEVADFEAAMREVPCPGDLGKGASLYQYFIALPIAQEPFLTPRAEALAALPMAAYTRVLGDLVLHAEQIVDQMQTRKVMRVQAAQPAATGI